jgi:hypothetical protein
MGLGPCANQCAWLGFIGDSPTQQNSQEPCDDQQTITTTRLSSHLYESKATNSLCTVGNVFNSTLKRLLQFLESSRSLSFRALFNFITVQIPTLWILQDPYLFSNLWSLSQWSCISEMKISMILPWTYLDAPVLLVSRKLKWRAKRFLSVVSWLQKLGSPKC